jgi:hypothetical protein
VDPGSRSKSIDDGGKRKRGCRYKTSPDENQKMKYGAA